MAGTLFLRSAVLTPPNTGGGDPPPTATSPTGRDPLFLWSAEQQAVWQAMRDNQHWYWNLVLSNADKTGTSQQRYDDKGDWCTYVYQATGDTAYATKAWTLLESLLNLPLNSIGANNVRENFAFYVILVDWLWPSFDSTKKANAITYLERWANFAIANGTNPYYGGFGLADTDAMHGYYAGLAALHYLNVPENTNYLNWLNRTDRNTGRVIGALALPGSSTIRDAIEGYHVANIDGGVWMEGGGYNAGTVMLAMLLYGISRSVSGATDHFPRLADFFANYCYVAYHEMTPDWNGFLQYGDDEHPRDLQGRYYHRFNPVASFSGLLSRFSLYPTAAAFGNAVAQNHYTQHPTWLTNNNYVSRPFFFYNPYAPVGTLPTGQSEHWASGMGQQYVKDTESLAWISGPTRTFADHEVWHGATFQLYRDGQWIIRSPVAYDTQARPVQISNRGVNGLVLYGLSGSTYSSGVTRRDSGSDWWAIRYEGSGAYHSIFPGFYDPPPNFVNQYERRVVYFKENGFDVFVVLDVLDADDPETLAKFTRYYSQDQAQVAAKVSSFLFTLHTPTSPSPSGQVGTWVSGSLTGRCHTLLPSSGMTLTAVDESVLWSGVSGVTAAEKKYQLTVHDATDPTVLTMLHVITAGPTAGTEPTISGASAGGVTVGSRTITFGSPATTVS